MTVFRCVSAFPNSKLSPPKRGDNDFMMRSNKLNSDVDMLYDQLKSKIDFYWERLHHEFVELDKSRSGTVRKDNFKVRQVIETNNFDNDIKKYLLMRFEDLQRSKFQTEHVISKFV